MHCFPSQRVKVPALFQVAGKARVSTDNSVGPHLPAGHTLEQPAKTRTAINDDQTRVCLTRVWTQHLHRLVPGRSLRAPPSGVIGAPLGGPAVMASEGRQQRARTGQYV